MLRKLAGGGEPDKAANNADHEVNDDRHGIYVDNLEYDLDVTRELPRDDDENFHYEPG